MIRKILIAIALLSTASFAFGAPERIISAEGSLTEIVYALGEEKRLVGVDTTSRHPEVATELPQIGYMRNLSAEGSLSLAPDAMIASDRSGPPRIINQISQAGVTVKKYNSEPTLEGVRIKIEGVAEFLNKKEAGRLLWEKVSYEVDEARQRVANIANPVRVLFMFSAQGNSPVVGGSNTAADAMITMAGGINVATEINGYKPMTTEAIVEARPDVILMMKRGGNHTVTPEDIFNKPGLDQTPAARNNRLVAMDGLYLLGFGPRIGQAISDLSRELYPEQLARLQEE